MGGVLASAFPIVLRLRIKSRVFNEAVHEDPQMILHLLTLHSTSLGNFELEGRLHQLLP